MRRSRCGTVGQMQSKSAQTHWASRRILERPLSAQLRASNARSAMSAIRRIRPSAERKSGRSKMARQASCSTPSTRCSLHAGRRALSAAPIANPHFQARPVVFRLTGGFYNPAPSFGAGRGDGAVTALRSIAGRLLAAPCAFHRADNAYGRHHRLSASTVLMGHSQEFDQAAAACPNMASGRR
jgi:hypothetical protein